MKRKAQSEESSMRRVQLKKNPFTTANRSFLNKCRTFVVDIPNCNPQSQIKLIKVTVASDETTVSNWITSHSIMNKKKKKDLIKSIGFDIEWKPSFTAGVNNKVALIQLSTESDVLLIQIAKLSGIPLLLKDLFLDKSIIKVGVAVRQDLKKLQNDYGIESKGYADIAFLASTLDRNLKNTGLKTLYQNYFQVDIPKPRNVQMGNWEATTLSQAQINYAAWDSLMSKQIYDHVAKLGAVSKYQELADRYISQIVIGTRFEYRQLYRPAMENDHFLDKVLERIDIIPRRHISQHLEAAGGTYKLLLQIILSRLNFSSTRYFIQESPGVIRSNVVVRGRLISSEVGKSKSTAAEFACQKIANDLLKIEGSFPMSKLLPSFAGVTHLPDPFVHYIYSKPEWIAENSDIETEVDAPIGKTKPETTVSCTSSLT